MNIYTITFVIPHICTIVPLFEDGSVLLELPFELTGYLRQSLIMFIQCTCMCYKMYVLRNKEIEIECFSYTKCHV